jgi:hypothetical protein
MTVILAKVWWLKRKLRERLSVIKRATQKFDMQRSYLKKLNDTEVKEQYQLNSQKCLQFKETL